MMFCLVVNAVMQWFAIVFSLQDPDLPKMSLKQNISMILV